MKIHAGLLLASAAAVLLSSAFGDTPLTGAADGGVFVRAADAGLTRGGAPFRALGFNQPDLFSALLTGGDEGRKKSCAALEDAARSEVRFLRFWASAFWPCDMKLYFADPKAYWAAMDEVFSRARTNNVMLVPSIFWQNYLWSDLCDEPRQAMADPASKTYAAMHAYAAELVTRYKDDPNVLLWELGNEYFLSADLNPGYDPTGMGAGARHLGTRPRRALDDSLTTDRLRAFYTNMTAHIHALDPNHLVTSGDAGVRHSSRSLRESFPKCVFKPDALNDHLASLLGANPAPLDVLCIHYYGNLKGEFWPGTRPEAVGGLSTRGLDLLTSLARTATAARLPLFVGELGQHDPRLSEEPDARFLCAAIDRLEAEGADLIGIWAWHFPLHDKENVTGSTYPALMKRVREFNQRYAGGRHPARR